MKDSLNRQGFVSSIAEPDQIYSQRNAMLAETAPPVVMPDKMPTLRVVPMPSDANQSGDIFGGWIMSQVDIAGGIAASRRARGRVVTVSVDSFVFKQPSIFILS